MIDQEVLLKLNDHDHEIQDLKTKVNAVQDLNTQISNMALNIQKLAINIETMAETQKDTIIRLSSLEKVPLEDSRYYKRLIVGCLITGLIGAVLGAIMALIIKGQ